MEKHQLNEDVLDAEKKIAKRISELEEIERELLEDISRCVGNEKEKNILLHQATSDALFQLRQALQNLAILRKRYQ